MKKVSIVLWVLVVANAALADAPKMVRSEPADGATQVPVELGMIRFYFDRNMKMNQWTFWQSVKGKFPPMAGENDAP